MKTFESQFLEKVLRFRKNEISIIQFRDWLLEHFDDSKRFLGEDLFEDFLLFNYNDKYPNESFIHLLSPKIDWSVYEQLKLETTLYAILAKKDIFDSLMKMYDWYCYGYRFLEALGMKYGLEISYKKYFNCAEGNAFIEREFENIERDTKEVLGWLERKEIILNKEDKDKFPRLSFQDFRKNN